MPTYEYVCSKCEHHFEVTQRITAEALTVCLKEFCPRKPWGKGKVKRTVGGGSGLLFKGSGFYITDYRSEGYKAAAKKDAGGSSSESGKKETKSNDSGGAKPAGSPPPASSGPKKD
jgi:putative FmdB family regulatory protein